MATHADKRIAAIELVPAQRGEETMVANLLELYIHDFSEFVDVEIGADGRFGYADLPLYWSDPDRHAFLIRMDGKLAGLVFVRRVQSDSESGSAWDMAEFFVLRGYRRRGLGTEVAHEVWKQFPERWRVRVREANVPALHFWARAIAAFLGEAIEPARVERAGDTWRVFAFESRRPG
jgi:predicted acetyltransferase